MKPRCSGTAGPEKVHPSLTVLWVFKASVRRFVAFLGVSVRLPQAFVISTILGVGNAKLAGRLLARFFTRVLTSAGVLAIQERLSAVVRVVDAGRCTAVTVIPAACFAVVTFITPAVANPFGETTVGINFVRAWFFGSAFIVGFTDWVFRVHPAILFVRDAVIRIHFAVEFGVAEFRKLLAVVGVIAKFGVHLAVLFISDFYVAGSGFTFTRAFTGAGIRANPLVIAAGVHTVFASRWTTITPIERACFAVVLDVTPAIGNPSIDARGFRLA